MKKTLVPTVLACALIGCGGGGGGSSSGSLTTSAGTSYSGVNTASSSSLADADAETLAQIDDAKDATEIANDLTESSKNSVSAGSSADRFSAVAADTARGIALKHTADIAADTLLADSLTIPVNETKDIDEDGDADISLVGTVSLSQNGETYDTSLDITVTILNSFEDGQDDDGYTYTMLSGTMRLIENGSATGLISGSSSSTTNMTMNDLAMSSTNGVETGSVTMSGILVMIGSGQWGSGSSSLTQNLSEDIYLAITENGKTVNIGVHAEGTVTATREPGQSEQIDENILIYVTIGGKTYGPFTSEELDQMDGGGATLGG